MVAQTKEFSSYQLQPDPVDAMLFEDERRLQREVQRFLDFAVRHGSEPTLRTQLKPMLNVSGKKIRPLFPFWLMRALGVEDQAHTDAIARVAAVTLVLHSAAIVIDDIEDGSTERQAQMSLHLRNGLGPTLNSAGLLIFAALEYLGDPALLALGVDTVARCHTGQALDLAFGDPRVAAPLFQGGDQARRQRWLDCTRMKTSQLMEFSVRAAARVLHLPEAVTEKLAAAIVDFGIGYQILDDVKNLRPDLVGAKAYEDLPVGLRSWVCLEVLSTLSDEARAHARSLYGGLAFVAFIQLSPELPAAVQRSMAAAAEKIAAAEAALIAITGGSERGYLSRLFDRPAEDLRELAHG